MSPAQLAAAALIAASTMAAPDSTQAAAVAQARAVTAPAHVSKYVGNVAAAGQGRLTWFGFHVYDAALYTAAPLDPAAAETRTFVLELTYARRLEGRAIAKASADEIERLGFGSPAQRADWLAKMEALFPNVERGRRLAGVHLPGVGARFYFDGAPLGSIDDPEFARAFFAIWLDARTRAPQLRASLLRGGPVGDGPT